jgi:Fe2+ or Zn2+ uptake regulation protein
MISETKGYLQSHGIKPSLQRMAVMDYLFTHRTHPTADDIFQALYPTIPTLSKTTIYNTLKLLVENGAALGLDIDEKQTHYDGDTSLHAHFRCKNCGKIVDLPIEKINKSNTKLLDGFVITEVNLYYKGYCNNCSHEEQQTIINITN